MTHDTVAIQGSTLLAVWSNDNLSPAEHAGVGIEPGKWYRVVWPDHVTTPRYNGDCSIIGPYDSAEQADADSIYYP